MLLAIVGGIIKMYSSSNFSVLILLAIALIWHSEFEHFSLKKKKKKKKAKIQLIFFCLQVCSDIVLSVIKN